MSLGLIEEKTLQEIAISCGDVRIDLFLFVRNKREASVPCHLSHIVIQISQLSEDWTPLDSILDTEIGRDSMRQFQQR